MCSLWVDAARPSKKTSGSYTEFWENGTWTDFTLLIGPKKVPMKVHRVVLAAHFEYFKSMFSGGFKESASTEEHLPFVSPEDLRLILNYAYSEEPNLSKYNVFKVMDMASYFGSQNLTEECCSFIKNFMNKQNCFKLMEVAFQMDFNQLKKYCIMFTVDYLPEINEDDLSALPVELLIEIVQHPAAVIFHNSCAPKPFKPFDYYLKRDRGDDAVSEERMFHLIWNKVRRFPEETKTEWIPRVLKSIHLPQTRERFLSSLLREVGHIPEARDLIMKAGEVNDASETREWYLRRCKDAAWVPLFKCGKTNLFEVRQFKCDRPIEVNGATSDEYSECVLVGGFPFFIYATYSTTKKEKEYHAESPWAIEHLGLPYKVILEVSNNEYENVPVNTYHNGVVDKRIMDESYNHEGRFRMSVRLQ